MTTAYATPSGSWGIIRYDRPVAALRSATGYYIAGFQPAEATASSLSTHARAKLAETS
jgi:hypothetical protein